MLSTRTDSRAHKLYGRHGFEVVTEMRFANRGAPLLHHGKAAPGYSERALTDEESFRCVHCKERVSVDVFGTAHRNHCPRCLWSRHLDDFPGDRKSSCKSGMEPAAVAVRSDGEWAHHPPLRGLCGVAREPYRR